MSDFGHDIDNIRKQSHRSAQPAPDAMPTHDNNPITRLQRMIGNRGVQRLMMSDGSPIQTKMTVTAANDAYEAEADAVADQVVRKFQSPDVSQRNEDEDIQAKRIQREGDDEELQAKRIQREGDDEELQAKRIQRSGDMMGSFSVGEDFEKSLSSARGGGSAIPSGVRENMEGAMGADFSNVRIHQGAESDALNTSIQAKAFTTGSDIFFKSGQYNPSSTDGQKLLAHELTHTIQQGAVNTKRDESKG